MSTIDEKIDALREDVKKQQTELKETEKKSNKRWITNTSFDMEGMLSINIPTANLERVKRVMGLLIREKQFSDAANEVLGIKEEFLHDGYSIEDWTKDLKTRLAKISLKEKKTKLDRSAKALEKIMSEDQRREMELSNIMDDLKD